MTAGVGARLRRGERVLDVRVEGLGSPLPGSLRRDVRLREVGQAAFQRKGARGHGEEPRLVSFL